MKFTAIILAADRERKNPVAEAANVSCKALAPVNGIPMIKRVVGALAESESVGEILICGPQRDICESSQVFQDILSHGRTHWIEPAASPSRSAWNAMKTISPNTPVLLTTGDHALIGPEIIDFFCTQSLSKECDVTAGLADADAVEEQFLGVKRTAYKLGGKRYCSCNLFGLTGPDAINAAKFWQKVETKRKHPLKIVNSFGWTSLLKYILGFLTLNEAMKRISKCLGCRADAVLLPYPEAAVDVDTVRDLELASHIAARL